LVDGFFSDSIDIKFLERIKCLQDKGQEHYYLLERSLTLQSVIGYEGTKTEFDERCDSLIKRGYLKPSDRKLGITEEGRCFLINYYRFKGLGYLAKFTKIFKENFSSILSIFACVISIASIIITFLK
jgi:hypothetical protein